jgi:hypothetical protein
VATRQADLLVAIGVVDEVPHATAPSYRRILAGLDPRFLLLGGPPDRDTASPIGPYIMFWFADLPWFMVPWVVFSWAPLRSQAPTPQPSW